METMRRGRGRPLGPPGASLRLIGLEAHPGAPQGARETIWAATALTETGLRLLAPRGGSRLTLDPRALGVLGEGLYEAARVGRLPTDAQMSLGCAGVRIAARKADGDPQVALRWIRSPGILLMGDEIVALARIAELSRDFSREFRSHPRLEYWAAEAADIVSIEVLDAATGIPLPRRIQKSSSNRVAA